MREKEEISKFSTLTPSYKRERQTQRSVEMEKKLLDVFHFHDVTGRKLRIR